MLKVLVGAACVCVMALTAQQAYSAYNDYSDAHKSAERREAVASAKSDCRKWGLDRTAAALDKCVYYHDIIVSQDNENAGAKESYRMANRDALNASAM